MFLAFSVALVRRSGAAAEEGETEDFAELLVVVLLLPLLFMPPHCCGISLRFKPCALSPPVYNRPKNR